MSDLLSPATSWYELYQRLAMAAELSRGMITITEPEEGNVSFPRTTSRDAYAVAMVFDQAINDHGSESLVSRWVCESDLLVGEPDDAPLMYVGNRSFWASVAAAATELDQAQVALPDSARMIDAMRELRTEVPAPRNGGGCSLATKFPGASWREMALRQLAFFRELRGIEADTPRLPGIPRTCNADVLMLADYWTEQLAIAGRSAEDTRYRLADSCWRAIMACADRNARGEAPHATFPENEAFWGAVLLLATQSDACNEQTVPWVFHGPTLQPRNAAAPVDTGATLDFPSAKTWDEAAQMQRDAFSSLRGEDRVTGRLIARVPRTTNSDVRQVAAYWQAGLARVGEHSFADLSYKHVLERWRAVATEVSRIPTDADPSAVYAHNTDFWEGVLTIAIQIAVTAEAPSRWQLAKEATKQAIVNLPDTLRTAVADFTGRVLAKPLLYAGVGLGSLAALVFMLRRPAPRSDRENRS